MRISGCDGPPPVFRGGAAADGGTEGRAGGAGRRSSTAGSGEDAARRFARGFADAGVNQTAAPLSAAAFIAQHIAQERLPHPSADPRAAAGCYDRRVHRPPRRYDLIRPV